MRVAVLDLGTNTFNLIVAEQLKGTIQILHNSKLPVKLGEGSINKGTIAPPAFNRGLKAIEKHYKTILDLEVQNIQALGTSGIRTAKNGEEFLHAIKEKTGIVVEIIDGNREAELIYYGVRETFDMSGAKYLILDIGGGSNEFIIADNKTIFWKKSYKLGIARLLEKFKPSDPIDPQEISDILSYLESQTKDLFEEVKKHNVKVLVGASGSFETFSTMILNAKEEFETEASIHPHVYKIELAEFDELYAKLIRSSLSDRKAMKGLEPMRIEMIVLASLFVKFIIEKLELSVIYQTNYSLKEGVIYQLFNP